MTDPLELLPTMLAETPGPDPATFERMAAKLDAVIEASGAQVVELRPKRNLRRLLAVAAALILTAAALLAIGLSASRTRARPAGLPHHARPVHVLPLSAWVILVSPVSSSQYDDSIVFGRPLRPIAGVDARTGRLVSLPWQRFWLVSSVSGTVLAIPPDRRSEYLVRLGMKPISLDKLVPGLGRSGVLQWVALAEDGSGVWAERVSRDQGSHVCSIELVDTNGAVRSRPLSVRCTSLLGSAIGNWVALRFVGNHYVFVNPIERRRLTIKAPGYWLSSLDGRYIVWHSLRCTSCTWATDLTTGRTMRLPATAPYGSAFSYSPVSPDVAFVPHNGRIEIADALTGRVVLRRRLRIASKSSVLSWSPDGRYVFVASGTSQVIACPAWSDNARVRVIHTPVDARVLWIARD